MKIKNIEDSFLFLSYNCFLIVSLHVSYWIFLESCYSKKEEKNTKGEIKWFFSKTFQAL